MRVGQLDKEAAELRDEVMSLQTRLASFDEQSARDFATKVRERSISVCYHRGCESSNWWPWASLGTPDRKLPIVDALHDSGVDSRKCHRPCTSSCHKEHGYRRCQFNHQDSVA